MTETVEEHPRYRARQIPIEEARAGDHAIFKSGPRRIESVDARYGIEVVQLANGKIGGRSPGSLTAVTVADGVRRTRYMPSDLVHMGVRRAWRIESLEVAA